MRKKQMKEEIERLTKEVDYWKTRKNEIQDDLALSIMERQKLEKRIAELDEYWSAYSKIAQEAIMDIRNRCELYNLGVAVLNEHREQNKDGEC